MVAMTEKKKIAMNMDDLTFGELEAFEDVTGMVMSDAVKTDFVRDKDGRKVADPDDPKGRPLMETKMGVKAMMGMVFLSLRRDDPSVTWEQIRNMKLSDVELDLSESVDDGEGKAEEAETQPQD
jgi:small nuclear ribonucleoprotein (snRNP)-like protein